MRDDILGLFTKVFSVGVLALYVGVSVFSIWNVLSLDVNDPVRVDFVNKMTDFGTFWLYFLTLVGMWLICRYLRRKSG